MDRGIMVVVGFGKECSHVYSSCRREFLEESFSRLGLQKLSIEDVHKMQWQDLEDEIERWLKASNVALRILFPSERRLCDRVFFGFFAASDLSFMEVCRGSTIQLLNFADAVAIGSRSPERLFRILDIFETLRDLIPEFESLFSDQYCLSLRNEALTIWKRLAEAIRGDIPVWWSLQFLMMQLEASIHSRRFIIKIIKEIWRGTPKIQKPEKLPTDNEIISSVFLGTKDKCASCQKTVYPTERETVNGTSHHKGCFKCSRGGCTITSANFITHEGKLYCKHHHIQLFKEKGNYSQLDGDRPASPSLKEMEDAVQGFEDGEQGGNDDCNSLCETDSSMVSSTASPTCHDENASCSSSHREFVSESDDVDQLAAGDVTPMMNQDPKRVLEKLNLQLLDKNGREVPIQVKYGTFEKKKKTRKESVMGKNIVKPANS